MSFPRLRTLSCLTLLSLAVFALADEPRKDPPPNKDKEPAKMAAPDVLKMLADLIPQIREEAARKQAAQNLKQIGIALKQYDQQVLPPGQPNPAWFQQILPYIEQDNLYRYNLHGWGGLGLGVEVTPVPPALASQLKLGKDAGQLVSGEVKPDSAAGKAGLKQYDILLELAGKPVTGDSDAYRKIIDGIKKDATVSAVVLREGKRSEVKGLKLVDEPLGASAFLRTYQTPVWWGDGIANTHMFSEQRTASRPGWKVWTQDNVLTTTTHRAEDRFTTRQQEGTLVLTVIGTIKDGKAVVSSIKVQDGGAEKRYAALDLVPQEYRDKVAELLKLSEQAK
jgi:hypothetical protein